MSSRKPSGEEPLLSLRGLCIVPGPGGENQVIDLDIYRGERHVILGSPGAGKTSLTEVMAGVRRPARGGIRWKGQYFPFLTIRKARALGIECVNSSEPGFADMTIADCFHLFRPAARHRFLYHGDEAAKSVGEFFRAFDIGIDPHARMEQLSDPAAYFIQILRRLFCRPALLVLDDIGDKLTPEYEEKLTGILDRVQGEGMSTIITTHNVDQLLRNTDRVSVIREGRLILTQPIKDMDAIGLLTYAYASADTNGDQKEPTAVEFSRVFRYVESVLDALPVNLIVADVNLDVHLINVFARRSFGWSEAEPPGRNIRDLFDGDPRLLAAIMESLASGEAHQHSAVPFRLGKLGPEADQSGVCDLATYPMVTNGVCLGYIIMIDDITERVRMQERVFLSEKLASVSILAAGIAHEINHPLAIIQNIIEYLKSRHKEGELREEITNIEEETRAIAAITRNFMSFYNTDASGSDVFDVNGLIEKLIDLLRPVAEQKGIAIRFEKREDPLNVYANPNEIRAVLINLVKNAFEAIESLPGLVSIRTFWRDAASMQVVIEDNGPGIDEGHLKDVFLPFYSTKQKDGANYGLGLYVSYKMVEKAGGTISLENIAPHGCRFTVTLPLP